MRGPRGGCRCGTADACRRFWLLCPEPGEDTPFLQFTEGLVDAGAGTWYRSVTRPKRQRRAL